MRPFTLLIKPAGPDCNLTCRYCFYDEKATMFPGGAHRMTDEVAETMVRDYLKLRLPISSFAFQGGEPTLMGLDFYQRIVAWQKQYGAPGQQVSNALQTNGILLDDEWCRFLHEYQFLLGISLDGPQRFHDHYRLNHAGHGSYDHVMAAIDTCRRHRVEFNILALVNDRNVEAPDELFDFFIKQGFRFLQFIPCVERDPATPDDPVAAPFAVDAAVFGRFMCRIFDRWLEFGPTKLSVRLFDSTLNYYVHGRHTNCTFNERCNDYIVIEHNGDVFTCDFFVEDACRLGNIMETPVEKLFDSPGKRKFARLKRQLANQCIVCRHHAICRGGCLKDRRALTDRFDQPSYLCDAYRMFFDHAGAKLMELAAQVRSQHR